MFTHILVPLDGSAFSETAIKPALSLGEKYGAKVTLVTVILRIPESRLHVPMYDQQSEERGRHYLEEIRAAQGDASPVPIDKSIAAPTTVRFTIFSTAGTSGGFSSTKARTITPPDALGTVPAV